MLSRRAALAALICLSTVVTPAWAAQDDAGTGRDAGNTFDTATRLPLSGSFAGRLDGNGGDTDDFYAFPLSEGQSFSVAVSGTASGEPIELLDPEGKLVDVGLRQSALGVSATNVFAGDVAQVRVSVHRALVAGDYRLHLRSGRTPVQNYWLCVMNCDPLMDAPIDLIFGGSLPQTDTQVLLVPPTHGDLGNPLGPTVTDYIDATLRGIRRWETSMAAFAADYPQFSYLKQIDLNVEVFDGVTPVDPAGYDVVVGYVAAGPVFRGVATDAEDFVEELFREAGIWDSARFSGRAIALSLFGSSPRAGQGLWDFPEVNDLENVTMHEFGHTFGLGHTRTWRSDFGADLMNSPASFIYGDGSPIGDGGERTELDCLSSLDLYGMAVLYDWVPSGHWHGSSGSVDLPAGIPYTWYC